MEEELHSTKKPETIFALTMRDLFERYSRADKPKKIEISAPPGTPEWRQGRQVARNRQRLSELKQAGRLNLKNRELKLPYSVLPQGESARVMLGRIDPNRLQNRYSVIFDFLAYVNDKGFQKRKVGEKPELYNNMNKIEQQRIETLRTWVKRNKKPLQGTEIEGLSKPKINKPQNNARKREVPLMPEAAFEMPKKSAGEKENRQDKNDMQSGEVIAEKEPMLKLEPPKPFDLKESVADITGRIGAMNPDTAAAEHAKIKAKIMNLHQNNYPGRAADLLNTLNREHDRLLGIVNKKTRRKSKPT